MQIQKRTLNWLPRPSLYAEASAKLAKQKAAHQSFLSSQSNLASTVGSIMNTQMTEQTNIVSKVALARIQGKKTA
jgi:hypothetical protein